MAIIAWGDNFTHPKIGTGSAYTELEGESQCLRTLRRTRPLFRRGRRRPGGGARHRQRRAVVRRVLVRCAGVDELVMGRRGIKPRPLADRFWAHVIPEPNSGCWLWDGVAGPKGYGYMTTRELGKSTSLSTHVSLLLVDRPVPRGMSACHHCDNPSCVNPDHLFIGTARDNKDDQIRKGRLWFNPRGTHCANGHSFIQRGNRQRCNQCANDRRAAKREALFARGLTTLGTVPKRKYSKAWANAHQNT